MKWFKNLKTITKLMLGFGLIALLMTVVGYEGVSGMSTINGLLNGLYNQELPGIEAIKDVDSSVALAGRETRTAMSEMDSDAIEQRRLRVETHFSDVSEAITRAEGHFFTEEGKAQIATLKQVIPEYRSICAEAIRLYKADNKKEAFATLARAGALGDRVLAATQKATATKEERAKSAFENGTRIYEQSRTTMIGLMFGAVLASLGLGFFLAKLISNPLSKTVEVLQAVAAGDLTRSMEVETKDEIGQMADALNAAVAEMREALSEVRGSAETVATAAEQLASSSEELSSGAQEQASGLEETSASLEEITSSVRQNADNAKQANQLATAARDSAEKGGQVVESAVSAMGEINTSSKKIADIITAIDEIAFQTNLLALNAAVEAARAGEQGRGFAVVASEVRSLAQRSATAAKEIKALIQDSVRKVESGSEMVNRSGQVLQEIVSSVKRVTDIVGEIAAASHEQATGVEEVAKAMSQMDKVTQENSSQTEELSSTAQGLSTSAEQLQGMVGHFKLGSDREARRSPVKVHTPVKGRGRAGTKAASNSASHKGEPEQLAALASAVQSGEKEPVAGGFNEF